MLDLKQLLKVWRPSNAYRLFILTLMGKSPFLNSLPRLSKVQRNYRWWSVSSWQSFQGIYLFEANSFKLLSVSFSKENSFLPQQMWKINWFRTQKYCQESKDSHFFAEPSYWIWSVQNSRNLKLNTFPWIGGLIQHLKPLVKHWKPLNFCRLFTSIFSGKQKSLDIHIESHS